MSKIRYVNGQYVEAQDAFVSMEDRGYQFADGIYEVMVFYNRRFVDEALHLKRLWRSLKELRIDAPMSEAAMKLVIRELVRRNNLEQGVLYIQVTRGVYPRNHAFPTKPVKPALTMAVMPLKLPKPEEFEKGVSVVSHPDLRWKRCDIKSIALLPNILAKQYATEKKAREVFLTNEKGEVTEGCHSNAYIVKKGAIITYPASNDILNGVRRQVIEEFCRKKKLKLVEKVFSLKEAMAADEAFLSSATSMVLPVSSIDGKKIGKGVPGPLSKQLLELYKQSVTKQTGMQWS